MSGNVVPEGFYPFLSEVLQERRLARGLSDPETYLQALATGRLEEEWRYLLAAITVKESFFFRTPQHFAALREVVIPQLVKARASSRRLKLWSAGCARGEEPATLAIVLAEHPLLAGWSWHILATDVDEEALAAARRGLYSERAIALVPESLRQRYFARKGEVWAFSPRLAQHITYRYLNLVAEPFPALGGPFDVIMLRNVLIYFRLPSQQRVLGQLAQQLAMDGFLFLGPAETVWQVSDQFFAVDLGDCFAYQRRATVPTPPPPRRSVAPAPRPHPSPPPKWSPKVAPPTPAPPPNPDPAPDPLRQAVGLLSEGNLTKAQELLHQVLAANPADPQAHALEGYLHEVAGRGREAIAAFRASLYLDPQLFQARLLLAHALRRAGEARRAMSEYRQVLGTLATGQGKELDRLSALPLPTQEQASRQAKAALQGLEQG
ncbi:MAG: hypothetical protein NZ869_02560 [Thermoanaerobaculum sp.]|nr:hypothetical protein [Thermoanaerobaculum sp.]